MDLFDKIPERFFSVLTSSKTPLYVQALFVIKKAFDSVKGLKEQKIFQTNSFVKLIENQFLSSGFRFSRDLKSFKDHIKVHYVKQSI